MLAIASVRYGALGGALVFLLGVALAVLLQRRRRATVVAGAVWTAPADLLLGSRKLPGQLSVLSDTIIWRPSSYSVRRGVGDVRIGRSASARVSGAPAVGDVFLVVTSPEGELTTFLTRRSQQLAQVISPFGREDS